MVQVIGAAKNSARYPVSMDIQDITQQQGPANNRNKYKVPLIYSIKHVIESHVAAYFYRLMVGLPACKLYFGA